MQKHVETNHVQKDLFKMVLFISSNTHWRLKMLVGFMCLHQLQDVPLALRRTSWAQNLCRWGDWNRICVEMVWVTVHWSKYAACGIHEVVRKALVRLGAVIHVHVMVIPKENNTWTYVNDEFEWTPSVLFLSRIIYPFSEFHQCLCTLKVYRRFFFAGLVWMVEMMLAWIGRSCPKSLQLRFTVQWVDMVARKNRPQIQSPVAGDRSKIRFALVWGPGQQNWTWRAFQACKAVNLRFSAVLRFPGG